MIDLLPGGSSAPPGLRRPQFSIAFGSGGGGGALGGLGSAVADAVGLGGGADDPWKRNLVSLTLNLGLAPMVDALELVLMGDAGAPSIALGDAGTVALGYADDPDTLVFTGAIDRIVRGIDGRIRVNARNGGGELAFLRINQSYENLGAADIATDLAGRVSVDTGVLESGETMPFVALDDRSSGYAHIADLARRDGRVSFIDAEGRLHLCTPGSGQPVQTFSYGSDILELEIAEIGAEVGEATVHGEGAAGSEGQDAWAWLVKDPASVTGTAGSGAPERRLADRAIRSAAQAGQAAQGRVSAAAARTATGRVRVGGAPLVRPGSVVAITGAPGGTGDGSHMVRRVRHRFDKYRGFVTEMEILSTGAGGGGLDGIGGLL